MGESKWWRKGLLDWLVMWGVWGVGDGSEDVEESEELVLEVLSESDASESSLKMGSGKYSYKRAE